MTGPTETGLPLLEGELTEMLFSATTELFTSMLGASVQIVAESEEDLAEPFDGVIALIGLTGTVVGNAALICTAATACDLAGRFLMTGLAQVDEEVLDAVGEIANMIVGGFKTLIEDRVGRVQMSIPTVMFGKNISTRNRNVTLTIAERCAYESGQVRLRVGLAPSSV
jgi:chemotaxis protein CheX